MTNHNKENKFPLSYISLQASQTLLHLNKLSPNDKELIYEFPDFFITNRKIKNVLQQNYFNVYQSSYYLLTGIKGLKLLPFFCLHRFRSYYRKQLFSY